MHNIMTMLHLWRLKLMCAVMTSVLIQINKSVSHKKFLESPVYWQMPYLPYTCFTLAHMTLRSVKNESIQRLAMHTL
jgi:cytochrome bd-type quinol oxidase subunit 2